MFNIALSWALLSSAVTTASSIFLASYFMASLSKTISPITIGMAINLAILWLLAIFFYLVLRIPRLRAFLKPTAPILTLLGIGNFILVLVSILSVFGITGIGGGASVAIVLALFAFGNLLTVPCWLALVGGNIWLLVRSISPGESGATAAKSIGPPSKAGLIVALAMLVPPAALFGWFYQFVASDMKKLALDRQAMSTRFEELCKTIRIDLYKTPLDPRSLYFPQRSDLTTGLLDYVDFTEVKKDPCCIKQSEAEYNRYTKVEGQKAFVNGKFNAVMVSVQEPEAAIEIATTPVTEAEDRKKGFYIEETSIIDRRTREPIAVFSKAEVIGGNRMETDKYFCPREFDRSSYKSRATLFALGLLDQEKSGQFTEALQKFRAGRPIQPHVDSKPAGQ